MKSKLALHILLISLSIFGLITFLTLIFPTYLYFNFSSSLPTGIYYKTSKTKIETNDLVLFKIPKKFSSLKKRKWLKGKDYLLKPVLGLTGDYYCIKNNKIFINSVSYGEVFSTDFEGKALPKLKTCKKVSKDNFLAISTYSNSSFDSRYIGEVSFSQSLGILKPLIIF